MFFFMLKLPFYDQGSSDLTLKGKVGTGREISIVPYFNSNLKTFSCSGLKSNLFEKLYF
jgi:hypothetical protein